MTATALVVLASGADDDTAGALRALCRVVWDAPAGDAEVRAADDRAEKMISTLGLATG